MMEITVKRNWWLLALWWPFAIGLAVVTVYGVTWPSLKAAQLGQPLPAGWSWPAIFIVDIAVIILAVALASYPLHQLRIAFTEEGIKAPGFLGSKFMRWNDIAYVDGASTRSLNLRLTSSDQSIVINKLYYQYPDEFMSLVQARVPETCSWRN